MQIQMTAQKIEMTEAIRSYAEKKLKRINSVANKISHIHLTFRIENVHQIAEANIHIPGSQIHAEAHSENIYESIDKLVDKINRQLDKYKGKMDAHH